jgi:hypothetical protein
MKRNILKLKNLVNLEWGNPVKFNIIILEKDLKSGILKEAVEAENRCLVFMTYLNDVPDGGTHFKYQELTTPAEKGLTLFGRQILLIHIKVKLPSKHEKYIITGWLGFA